jgi:hypothetical protein
MEMVEHDPYFAVTAPNRRENDPSTGSSAVQRKSTVPKKTGNDKMIAAPAATVYTSANQV